MNMGKVAWNKGKGKGCLVHGYLVVGPRRAHRIKMAEILGRDLKKQEIVHHWNENKTDNREENLCLMRSQSPHKRLHHFARRHGLKMETLKFPQNWLKNE